MTLEEIKNILTNHKADLSKRYPIKSLAVFGSYSRGDNTVDSDLDILVEFNDKVGIGFIDLADELSDLIGFKVDLVSKKGINSKYYKFIEEDLQYV